MATLKVKTSLTSTFSTDMVNSALYRLSYPYGRIVIQVIKKADSTALPAAAYNWRKCLNLSITEYFKDNQILAQCYRFYQNQFNSKLVKHTKYLVKNWRRWHNFNVTGSLIMQNNHEQSVMNLIFLINLKLMLPITHLLMTIQTRFAQS